MGITLENNPKPHGVRYPWSALLQKKRFVLRRGTDYLGASHGMAATLRQAARRHGVKVAVRVFDDRVEVWTGEGHDGRGKR